MEGEVGPNADTSLGPSSPPHDSDVTPVGSPDDTLHDDVHALPSDEDHGHDHEEDADVEHDLDQDQHSGPADRTEVLKAKIVKQVEYYFSDENLPTDKHMIGLIKKNKEGFVPITIFASFRKMKKLTRDHSVIVAALRESSFLVVSSDGKKVKRLHPFPVAAIKDPKLCTVLVENLPEDHSVENIRRIFGEAGKIKHISIRDPHAMEESKKGSKADILISSKLHALVEYDSVEAAEKAVAALNNEQDWRNGLRVKLLKQTGKYGQRKQPWRDVDAEKHNNGRASHQTGDEENHHPSEHHDDTPDEEDGEYISKEKPGQRARNRGRQRRNKYRATNGLGHGSTSCAHHIEPSKPPPGPKMPDGTRGFTMGRGRRPVPDQNQQAV
ncbi:la-related protein 6A [Ricinus communis]|uniref:la-related protein 6A n=1 Tax=Ricinus communis TaxID=3988 RepID=UPI00201AAFC6|nr:la-related protein 6A [Ricinus communis]